MDNKIKIKNLVFTVLTFVLVLDCAIANTRILNKKFKQYTGEDGLLGNNVSAILRDKYGFFWIGTYSGLNRFDGYNFKHFPVEANNPKSLRSKTILSLCEDKEGYIWVGTGSGGINRYNLETQKFTTYIPESQRKKEELGSNNIQELYQDSENNIWAGTSSNLLKYNREKDKFIKLEIVKNSAIKVTALFKDSQERLWVGTDLGLYYDNQKDDEFNPVEFKLQNKSISNVSTIHEDNKGNLWIGTSGQGLLQVSNSKVVKHYKESNNTDSPSSNYIRTISEDNKGRLWIGTRGNGIDILNLDQNEFYHVNSSSSQGLGLQSDYILSLNLDKNNIMWVGTEGKGLQKYNPRREQFKTISHKDNNQETLIDNRVTALTPGENGTVWMGTGKGINHYFPETGKVERYYLTKDRDSENQISVVKTLDMDKDGIIWIGTRRSGMIEFDPKSGDYNYYSKEESGLSSNDIFTIEAGDGKIWIATNKKGLNVFDKSTRTFESYTYNQSSENSIMTNDLWTLYKTKNKIWIGTTDKGLTYFDLEKEEFKDFNLNPEEPSKLKIVDITQDTQDNILACTNDGLLKYNSQTNKVSYILDDKDLPSTMFQSILVSSNNIYWISTDQGILRYNPENSDKRFFTKDDGLPTIRFLDNSSTKDYQGKYYFGTSAYGAIYFNPQEITQNKKPPNILITDFKINNTSIEPGQKVRGKVLLDKAIYLTDTLNLSYNDDVLRFRYTGLHSVSPENNEYKYKLENFDKEWNQVGNQRRAKYTNLPAGEYVFKVKSSNCDGFWNKKPASIRLIIPPPFWQTIWFRGLIILGLVGVVLLIIRLRTKKLKKRHQVLKEMNDKLNKQIEEKVQAKRELEKTNIYIDNIIDSMPSILVSINSEGEITHWNNKAEEITGIDSEEVLGEELEKISPDFIKDMNKVWKAIKKDEIQTIPEQKRELDGKTIYEKVTIYPLMLDEVNGAVIRVDDRTEQKQLEEMMIQSEKMISVGGLAAGMAHEINNPLAGMMQNASVIKRRLTKKDLPNNLEAADECGTSMDTIEEFMQKRNIPELLDMIHDSGIRANKIVENMLNFARKGDSEFRPEEITEILEDSIELAKNDYDLKKDYDFRNIEIERKYSENLPEIWCEKNKIEQVCFNILKNGAEAMHSGKKQRNKEDKSKFIIRILKEEEMVRIEIEDNGPGIPEKDRNRIFEPFFTTKDIDHGTGLGLAVSYFIITENHNGKMYVQSNPEEGTNFIIKLPIKQK